MNIIKRENSAIGQKSFIKDNEIYQFIVNAFKEGTVPLDKDEFESCFNNNTTDGSLCFANQFAKGEDDAVMLFFYPYYCAVPSRYQKNLRSDDFCRVNLLILDYQRMFATKIDNLDYLQTLREYVEQRFAMNKASLQYEVYKHFNRPRFEDDFIDEAIKKNGENSIKTSLDNFTQKYNELIAYLDNKIKNISAEAPKADNQSSKYLEEEAESEAE